MPFTDAYFLEDALRVRRETRLPLALVGGIRKLEGMVEVAEQGFEFLAMARGPVRCELREPAAAESVGR